MDLKAKTAHCFESETVRCSFISLFKDHTQKRPIEKSIGRFYFVFSALFQRRTGEGDFRYHSQNNTHKKENCSNNKKWD